MANDSNKRQVKVMKDIVLHAYNWVIWRSHNDVVFTGKPFHPRVIANNIQSDAFFRYVIGVRLVILDLD